LIHYLVNRMKRDLVVGVLSEFLFEFFQSGWLMTVIRTDNVSWRAIRDTENKYTAPLREWTLSRVSVEDVQHS
jgi:hypothetical protein